MKSILIINCFNHGLRGSIVIILNRSFNLYQMYEYISQFIEGRWFQIPLYSQNDFSKIWYAKNNKIDAGRQNVFVRKYC